MKKLFSILLIQSLFYNVYAQSDSISSYTKKTYMVPMRDGTKLFTVVLTPAQQTNPSPFLVQRTPYGADFPVAEDSAIP
jgi:predicted acyl esterase